ncbi:MAG: hypothetical protein JWR83_1506 [Aeromicrobium sp.]|nr:hypothetical protein [Aeromicrobium sp.]
MLVGVVLSAYALASCGGSGSPTPQGTRYVALGDSFVAGAGIDRSTGACLRSDHNYAALLAASLKVENFADASCPGATTHDVLNGLQRSDGSFIPAQIDSVSPDTDLITISIGANDSNFIPALFACHMPTTNTSAACQTNEAQIPTVLSATMKSIVTVLKTIQQRAPHAAIVMVSYLRLMPDSGTCTAVQIAPADILATSQGEAQLDATMRAAAKDAGVQYVDMRTRSVGHDVCAAKDAAWVNGATPAVGDGTMMHPRERGMAAVAKAVKPVAESALAARGQ